MFSNTLQLISRFSALNFPMLQFEKVSSITSFLCGLFTNIVTNTHKRVLVPPVFGTTTSFTRQLFYIMALAVMFTGMGTYLKAQNGAGDQFVEMEYGTTDISYPLYYEKARNGECGGGLMDVLFPDYVLVYNTPDRGLGNPDNIKFWSDFSHVRWVMNNRYSGKLAAKGLKTGATRVCIGFAGRYLSVYDFRYIYLWRRKPIARR